MCITIERQFRCTIPLRKDHPRPGNFRTTLDDENEGRRLHVITSVVRCSMPTACLPVAISNVPGHEKIYICDVIKELYDLDCPVCVETPRFPPVALPVAARRLAVADWSRRRTISTDQQAYIDATQQQKAEIYSLDLLCWMYYLLLQSPEVSLKHQSRRKYVQYLWPETFCKIDRSHVAHDGCDAGCIGEQPYVQNLATAHRRYEAVVCGNRRRFREALAMCVPDDFREEPAATDTERVRRYREWWLLWRDTDNFPDHQLHWMSEPDDVVQQRYESLQAVLREMFDVMNDLGPRATTTYQGAMDPFVWAEKLEQREVLANIGLFVLALEPGIDDDVRSTVGRMLGTLLNLWPSDDALDYYNQMPGTIFFPEGEGESAVRTWAVAILQLLEAEYPALSNPMRILARAARHMELASEAFRRNRSILQQDASTKIVLAQQAIDRHGITYAESMTRAAEQEREEMKALEGLTETEKAARVDQATSEEVHVCTICSEPYRDGVPEQPVLLPCCSQLICSGCLRRILLDIPVHTPGTPRVGTGDGEKKVCPLCNSVPAGFVPPDRRATLGFVDESAHTSALGAAAGTLQLQARWMPVPPPPP